MRGKPGMRLATCLFMALIIGACTKSEPPPHLIVILLDALHAGHVSHLGYRRATTPNLDGLAREGIAFTQVLAPAPYTLASIPSLLTGRLPDTHGLVQKTSPRLSPGEVTLAEVMKENGYRTLGAVATGNGSSMHGLEQGFDLFVELFRGQGPPGRVSFEADGETLHIPKADEFLPVVDGWLREAGEPAFYYLHVLEPHSPYTPPEPFRSRYIDPDYEGPFSTGETGILVQTLRGTASVDQAAIHATIDLYDANVAYADHTLGLLLDRFKKAGLYDNALIVVTSDHGEAFWQHGMWGHNNQLYEEMLRVPLVVKLPGGREAGRRVDTLASLTDLLPGICQWLDLPLPANPLDGRSLAGLQDDTQRKLLIRSHHQVPLLASRSESGKLILGTDKVEYYDLANDPEERADLGGALSSTRRIEVERLRKLLEGIKARDAKRADPISSSQEKMLKALGY